MSEETTQNTGGLIPQYQTYERQKCFIAYSERAAWSDDLLSACQEVLCRPEFNLEPDDASKHFDPDVPLRQKVLELIANARYGIYDLSYWRDEKGEWHMPRNVFIELGIAIALNRPTLLLRHANNRELELPECLKSVSGHILDFSGETTLTRALEERLPQWVNAPPERDWWNRYCIFGGRVCGFREAYPRARQWGRKTLGCHISDGHDVDRDDFRSVIEEVLERFSDVTFDYLDALPVLKSYGFLLCTHCQTVRSTPFAFYRITPHTPAETFIAIGMSIALEMQFGYKISKILLTENVQDIPSLLSGYEVVVARSDTERKMRLRTFVPTVMHKVRETAWKPRSLPFIEAARIVDVLPQTAEQPEKIVAKHQILIVEDDDRWAARLKDVVMDSFEQENQAPQVFTGRMLLEAQKLLSEREFSLILTGLSLKLGDPQDRSGLELIRQVREQGISTPVIMVSATVDASIAREALRDLDVSDILSKSDLDPNELKQAIRRILGSLSADNQTPGPQFIEPKMILIPGGEFLMGSDPKKDREARETEQPQHVLYLPDYYMAEVPITNREYAAFVEATGHVRPEHWETGIPPLGKESHPVVNVSWQDAVAYCEWLSEVYPRPYRLPTEAEWEKASRGTDGRIYPWGYQWERGRCNSSESRIHDTTPVGDYPQGASPYGLLDTAGNVWEWTTSSWGKEWEQPEFKYPYSPIDGREAEDRPPSVLRVIRGGAFDCDLWIVRSAARGRGRPLRYNRAIGFRVATDQ